jgi:hypothetical protein
MAILHDLKEGISKGPPALSNLVSDIPGHLPKKLFEYGFLLQLVEYWTLCVLSVPFVLDTRHKLKINNATMQMNKRAEVGEAKYPLAVVLSVYQPIDQHHEGT